MALPSNVNFGTVTGAFLRAVADSPSDPDRDPEGLPVTDLTVQFTPDLAPAVVRDLGATPPVTILIQQIDASVDANGILNGPDGQPGVRLIASTDTDLQPTGWTWQATFKSTTFPSLSFSFALDAGATVDLASVVKVPASPGATLDAWLAAVAAATAAKLAAQQAADGAAGAVNGLRMEVAAKYVSFGVTAPNPAITPTWVDTSTVPPAVKGWNGTAWVAIGGGSGSQVNSDWTASSGLAQILNKPVLGTAASHPANDFETAGAASTAQAYAISAINAVSFSIAPVTLTVTGSLAANALNLVNATSGAFTATLPAPTKVGQIIAVEKTDTSNNAVAIGGTVRGSASSITFAGAGVAGEAFLFVAESLTSWRPVASHKPNALLDTRYATSAAVDSLNFINTFTDASVEYTAAPFPSISSGFNTIALNMKNSDIGNNFSTTTSYYTIPASGVYTINARIRITDDTPAGKSYGIGVHTSNADGPYFLWATSAPASTSGAGRQTLSYNRIAAFTTGQQLRLFAYANNSMSWTAAALSVLRVG